MKKTNILVGIIENLSAIAEQNAATTEEASASVENELQSMRDINLVSTDLTNIADELQQEVKKFKI